MHDVEAITRPTRLADGERDGQTGGRISSDSPALVVAR